MHQRIDQRTINYQRNKGTNESYISKRNQANQDGLISKGPSEPGWILSKELSESGRIILSKGPCEPGRILSKEPSEPLYYQRNQVKPTNHKLTTKKPSERSEERR